MTTGRFLKSLGIPVSLNGYEPLRLSIEYLLEHPDEHPKMMFLYKYSAGVLGKTYTQIERNVRHAVEYAFMHTHPDELFEVFQGLVSPDSGKVNNMVFVYTCADALRERKEEG